MVKYDDNLSPTKITIKVWKPLADKLEERMNETCLRRDAYLARVLPNEVQHLDKEVAVANSQGAYEFVQDQWKDLKHKSMSLALPPNLVEQLNAVCKGKRIVRDAFFNRFFLLLAVTPKNLDSILFPTYQGDWKQDVWKKYSEDRFTVEMGVLPLVAVTDPFWAIRAVFEIEQGAIPLHDWTDPESGKQIKLIKSTTDCYTLPENVYTKFLHKTDRIDLTGLNCYVADWQLPNNPVRERKDELEALLDLL